MDGPGRDLRGTNLGETAEPFRSNLIPSPRRKPDSEGPHISEPQPTPTPARKTRNLGLLVGVGGALALLVVAGLVMAQTASPSATTGTDAPTGGAPPGGH